MADEVDAYFAKRWAARAEAESDLENEAKLKEAADQLFRNEINPFFERASDYIESRHTKGVVRISAEPSSGETMEYAFEAPQVSPNKATLKISADVGNRDFATELHLMDRGPKPPGVYLDADNLPFQNGRIHAGDRAAVERQLTPLWHEIVNLLVPVPSKKK